MLDAHFTRLFFSPAVTRWAIIGFQLERPGASSHPATEDPSRWDSVDGRSFLGEIAESIEPSIDESRESSENRSRRGALAVMSAR